jgi:hypothetical protein
VGFCVVSRCVPALRELLVEQVISIIYIHCIDSTDLPDFLPRVVPTKAALSLLPSRAERDSLAPGCVGVLWAGGLDVFRF